MMLVLAGSGGDIENARLDQSLVKAILRGLDGFDPLASGQAESFAAIARAEGVTGRDVAHVTPLAFLAPDVVASSLAGTQPVDLTAQKLIKQIDLPLDWAEQRALLGFESWRWQPEGGARRCGNPRLHGPASADGHRTKTRETACSSRAPDDGIETVSGVGD